MKLTSRDWTEDFKYENGMYGNKCIKCGQEFIGYKRRLICKICGTKKAVGLKPLLARNLYIIIFSVMVFTLVALHTFYGFYNLLLTFICGMISKVLLEKHKKRIAG